MKQKVTTIGALLIAVALLTHSAMALIETDGETTARQVREANAVYIALRELEGIPWQRSTIQGYQFKTDNMGHVYMRYSDGWQAVK